MTWQDLFRETSHLHLSVCLSLLLWWGILHFHIRVFKQQGLYTSLILIQEQNKHLKPLVNETEEAILSLDTHDCSLRSALQSICGITELMITLICSKSKYISLRFCARSNSSYVVKVVLVDVLCVSVDVFMSCTRLYVVRVKHWGQIQARLHLTVF